MKSSYARCTAYRTGSHLDRVSQSTCSAPRGTDDRVSTISMVRGRWVRYDSYSQLSKCCSG